jgi:hypothetical protein
MPMMITPKNDFVAVGGSEFKKGRLYIASWVWGNWIAVIINSNYCEFFTDKPVFNTQGYLFDDLFEVVKQNA